MDDAKTVWCGNLSDKVTEELLYELFLQAAPLERVRIPTDKEGRKSNFAFVTFKHEQSVDYALQLLNGVRLYDKNLSVKPRNSNSSNALRFLERSLSYNKSPLKFANIPQQSQTQVKMPENRDNRQSSRGFRDNYREDNRYRDSPYNRHDDRDRDKHDSDRRKYGYNDRRNSFNDRQNNRRGNRYY